MEDNENKQIIYLIGGNVSKSKSNVIQNAIYEHLGINFTYKRLSIKTCAEVKDFLIRHTSSDNFFASNITFPYKKYTLDLLQSLGAIPDTACVAAGGTNLVLAPNLSTYNFDGKGCMAFLTREGFDLKNKYFVICGSGITAKSICCAAIEAGAAKVVFVSRSKRTASEVFDGRFSNHYHKIDVLEYQESEKAISNADFVINATPVGKYGCKFEHLTQDSNSLKENDANNCQLEGDLSSDFAINPKILHKEQVLLDVVYGKYGTALTRAAKQAGCKAFDGTGMLISQAVLCIEKICQEACVSTAVPFDFDGAYQAAQLALQEMFLEEK